MKWFDGASCAINPRGQLLILLLRGVGGIGLMALALPLIASLPWLGWTALVASVYLLKGCPACWGMHLANAMRSAASESKQQAGEVEIESNETRRNRPYQPKDMAEHLFPPEDVARFRAQKHN